MRYVGGGAAEDGCLFCRRLAAADDVRSLILHRGERAFVIMNLFPYNTGHLMLVPNGHVASPEEADPAVLAELATLLPPALRALRRVLSCDGFNVGLNVGAVAGAGVADHLHQHVVPRWQGDANFMPILASTMVLPELIPVTYAKSRAEFVRELSGANDAACVILADGDRRVLVEEREGHERLPVATAAPEEALWRAARRIVEALTDGGAEVAGWGGPARAVASGIALSWRVPDRDPEAVPTDRRRRWATIREAMAAGPDAGVLADALANLAPAGAA